MAGPWPFKNSLLTMIGVAARTNSVPAALSPRPTRVPASTDVPAALSSKRLLASRNVP